MRDIPAIPDSFNPQEEAKESKTLIAYHADCIDGFTSAWVCYKGLTEARGVDPDSITLFPTAYDRLPELLAEISTYNLIYIVDFSLPLDSLLSLQRHLPQYLPTRKITIIDHHKTAWDAYAGDLKSERYTGTVYGTEVILDLNECGASLVWNHFFPEEPMPILIRYVKDYDLWTHKRAYTKEVDRFLRLQPQTLKAWTALAALFEDEIWTTDTIQIGKSLLDQHSQIVDDIVETATPITLDGVLGLSANCTPNFSNDVGERLARISDTFGSTWSQTGKSQVKFSLRSIGDSCDVEKIAGVFGGGGHRNAAGFTLSNPDGDPMSVQVWDTGVEEENRDA